MKKNKSFFSPNFMAEFKKWRDDKEEQDSLSEGAFVNTKLKLKTLVERIDCLKMGENSVLDIAKYFLKNGGIIKEVNGESAIVKTKKGVFAIDKDDLFLI